MRNINKLYPPIFSESWFRENENQSKSKEKLVINVNLDIFLAKNQKLAKYINMMETGKKVKMLKLNRKKINKQNDLILDQNRKIKEELATFKLDISKRVEVVENDIGEMKVDMNYVKKIATIPKRSIRCS